jgi:hypothetical protein
MTELLKKYNINTEENAILLLILNILKKKNVFSNKKIKNI